MGMKWFLRYIYAWAGLLDSLIGIFTLGYIRTTYQLECAKRYARYGSIFRK